MAKIANACELPSKRIEADLTNEERARAIARTAIAEAELASSTAADSAREEAAGISNCSTSATAALRPRKKGCNLSQQSHHAADNLRSKASRGSIGQPFSTRSTGFSSTAFTQSEERLAGLNREQHLRRPGFSTSLV